MTVQLTWSPPKAVVFDFDGTLVDTLPGLLAATNRVLGEERRRTLTPDEAKPMLGGGAARLLERAFRATGEPVAKLDAAVARWRHHYDECAVAGTVLFPDVRPMLDALNGRGAALGICTSKPLGSTILGPILTFAWLVWSRLTARSCCELLAISTTRSGREGCPAT